MAGNTRSNLEAEVVFSALEQGDIHISALRKALADAGIGLGDPIYTAASALVACMRFSWTVLAEGEGIMRRGAARLDEAARMRVSEAQEHAKVSREETRKVYAKAAAEAVKQLNEQSEKVAGVKLKLRWGWSALNLLLGCAATAVVCIGLGAYLHRQYADAEMAEARAQVAAQRAKDAERETALMRAIRGDGPDRAEMWQRLIPQNDPVRTVRDCLASGRVTTAADGRRSCTVGLWIDPPTAPPVR